ncbi:MAG: metal-sulfur cluster assembly factor [Candidatus Pacebacteria bacterium]|jgi:metal-sulfur cluster biosynthetic enzyme|nr:metal-sulfur cluster assembly factor [Candidatus Paceibacterota bacterium]MBT4652428.1 metal-sulfur cluster assembly factor [Candidatus Paceibacterota bacterium]MBT6756255.1 metal-sulfur cluster assembly factor [Candidatus Paceibacterota bacterium]MBT6921546.1 metal-sulfur cluster assembly factor [Candidatus Paceibacterota bacterium]
MSKIDITEKKAYQALSKVIDPELMVDIVSLGLIYKVELPTSTTVKITMTLTTPGCPLAPVIDDMVRQSMFGLVDDVEQDVEIVLTFDPPWLPDMMSEEVRLELGL